VFMLLALDALEAAGVDQDNPIRYEGLRETYLPECQFSGRENRKIQFVILAVDSTRGGIEPDLLDEVVWWQTDDFWWFALAAAVAVIRGCAGRLGKSVPAFAGGLAERHGVAHADPGPTTPPAVAERPACPGAKCV
jgi:hypothetical protein